MTHQGGLNFSSSQTMPGDFDYIIYPTDDPEITIFVAFGRVASSVAPRIFAPILIHIAIRVAINCPQHRGPRIIKHEIAFSVISDRFALFIHDFSYLPKKWAGSR